jgi:putative transposase
MFEDEAGFGRINKPKYCWCRKGHRPSVPCHHIREYRYAYGAIEPRNGSSFFLVLPYCNTICMNIFLRKLSEAYEKDYILLVVDGAAWHRSMGLEVPHNIELFPLPPYTPEMNPIEQVWAWIRLHGFHNEVFPTLNNVIARLCDTIHSLHSSVIQSISYRSWMYGLF